MDRYESYSPFAPVDCFCVFCQSEDSTSKETFVTHGGGEHLHPIHKECAKHWVERQAFCPVCRMEIERTSLFSWNERVICELKYVAKDAVVGSFFGLILASDGLVPARAAGLGQATITELTSQPLSDPFQMAGILMGIGTATTVALLALRRHFGPPEA